MRTALSILFFLGAVWSAQAQTTAAGRVLDAADQSPLIGANVVLIHLPDSTKQGAAADPTGAFEITGLEQGRYVLTVSFLGYQTLRRPVEVGAQPLALGNITLQTGGVTLKGVEVVGKTPAAVQKGDTAQYNANAFKTNPDANAQDLITKMPGVTTQNGKVQAQGEDVQRVLVDGKEFFGNDPDAVLKNVPAEIIDKIEVFDRQSDQSQFSGFNDGNTQKTINIVTKPQFRNGQFGRFVAGVGGGSQTGSSSWAERYRVSGSYNMFRNNQRISIVAQSNNVNEQNFGTEDLLGVVGNSGGGGRGNRGGGGGPGGGGNRGGGGNAGASNFLVNQNGGITRTNAIGVNYSDLWGKKTQVTASYFFNLSNNTNNSNTFRRYAGTNQGQTYQENSLEGSRNINHRFSLRLEHKIDTANSILFIPRLSVQQNNGTSNLDGITLLGDQQRGNVVSNYRSHLTGVTSSNQLLYRHRFAKAGRTISLDLNANYNDKDGNNNLFSNSRSVSRIAGTLRDTTIETRLDQYSRLLQTGWQLSSGVSYTEPLSKTDILQLTYNVSYAPNDSDKKTYDFANDTGDYTSLNQGLSNVFTSSYLTQGIGASIRRQTRDFQAMIGVTGQRADLNNRQQFPAAGNLDRTYYNFLPNAMLRYNFSRQKNLRFNYNGRTAAPSISQLQEVVNNANPLQLTTGNPNLNQQFQHTATLRYSAAKPESSTSFFAGIFGSFTNNYITNSTFVAPQDTVININGGRVLLPVGGQLTRPINLGQQYSVRAFAVYGRPISAIKSNLNLNGSVGYSRTPGLNNNVVNYSQSPSGGLGATLSSNISPKVDFTLSSNGNLTYARNTVNTRLNTNYYVQNSALRLSWIVGPGFTLQSDVTHQYNKGLSGSGTQQYVLWNASLGKKVFENQRGEFKLYAFDILKQNRSIQNNISAAYNETVTTNILQQYFMVMFTYNLRNGNAAPASPEGRDGQRGGFPGGFPGGRPGGGGPGGPPPGGG
ncbi:TonB-dependent receptor [Hymenobacter sp. BT491]|uniref:TonB-dependent receptor n=1 Tax=Hymenobacter sp. BT491 TaxID=2766779 RepID=UPI00165383AF|nr:TonB-dependent receptor [Hymenobacter sp. BT491]MBC6990655.1 TonB-dependent receptor [Hymenobacter sp. BT491]